MRVPCFTPDFPTVFGMVDAAVQLGHTSGPRGSTGRPVTLGYGVRAAHIIVGKAPFTPEKARLRGLCEAKFSGWKTSICSNFQWDARRSFYQEFNDDAAPLQLHNKIFCLKHCIIATATSLNRCYVELQWVRLDRCNH
jgi:hypothetical protein